MTRVLTISKRLCYTLPPNRRLQEYAVMGEKDDTLLNSRQVAELLDLSPDTINELARKHSLPGMKWGRQWRALRRGGGLFPGTKPGAGAGRAPFGGGGWPPGGEEGGTEAPPSRQSSS